MKKIKLDKQETALEKEIESGEWVAVPDIENEIKEIRIHAHNFLNKNKKGRFVASTPRRGATSQVQMDITNT